MSREPPELGSLAGHRLRQGSYSAPTMDVVTPFVRAIVDVVVRQGVPREELFAMAQLDDAKLGNGQALFDSVEIDRLIHAAVTLTSTTSLGLLLARNVSESAFGTLSLAIAHAPSLRDAFGLSARFATLFIKGTHLELEERVDRALLRYRFARISPLADRVHAEFVVAGYLRLVQACAGGMPIEACAYFEHTTPADPSEHHRTFGDDVRFGQSFTGLEFQRALLDRASLHREPDLYAIGYARAEEALQRLSEDVRTTMARLREYLRSFAPADIPSMDEAARGLGMSTRSLRRHLASEGQSYKAVVSSLLESWTALWLSDPRRTTEEVARAAGFSGTPAFHRAFKRWKGESPTSFRKNSRGH